MKSDVCYSFEQIPPSSDDIVFPSIDATYILHITTASNSEERMDNIMLQLKNNALTKNIYILKNLGYKNCKKANYIKTAALDLTDAAMTAMTHALEQGYKTCLICEDDFLCTDKIKCKEVRKDINDFVSNIYFDLFNLGVTPTILIPATLNMKFYYAWSGVDSHAVIYSDHMMKKITSEDRSKLYHYDQAFRWNVYYYTYYIPLVCQLHGITDNSREWSNNSLDVIANKEFFHDLSYQVVFMQYKQAKLRTLFIVIYVLYIIFVFKFMNKK